MDVPAQHPGQATGNVSWAYYLPSVPESIIPWTDCRTLHDLVHAKEAEVACLPIPLCAAKQTREAVSYVLSVVGETAESDTEVALSRPHDDRRWFSEHLYPPMARKKG